MGHLYTISVIYFTAHHRMNQFVHTGLLYDINTCTLAAVGNYYVVIYKKCSQYLCTVNTELRQLGTYSPLNVANTFVGSLKTVAIVTWNTQQSTYIMRVTFIKDKYVIHSDS